MFPQPAKTPLFHVKQRRLTSDCRGIGEAVVVKIIVIGHQQVELVQKRIRDQTGAGGVGHVGGGIEVVPAFAAVQADHVPPVIAGAGLIGQAGDGQVRQAQPVEEEPGQGVEAVAVAPVGGHHQVGRLHVVALVEFGDVVAVALHPVVDGVDLLLRGLASVRIFARSWSAVSLMRASST